jgi:hypothetical protein
LPNEFSAGPLLENVAEMNAGNRVQAEPETDISGTAISTWI